MKYMKMFDKIGKQKIGSVRDKDVIVFCGDKRFLVTGINYDSGVIVGLNAKQICCGTCANHPDRNDGYEPPHTCDICTSLDSKEEFEMWEEAKND